jgi:hypothetical protein
MAHFDSCIHQKAGRGKRKKKYKNEKKKRRLTVKCEAHTYDLVIPPPFSAAVDDETAKKAE